MELTILLYILVIIAFAKGFGEVVSRFNQPAIVGELIAGIVLGPFVLGLAIPELDSMYSDPFVSNIADLGMLFLMLYVGLEFSPRMIKESSWMGGAVAAWGIVVPLLLGLAVGVLSDLGGVELAFVAVAMSVTALPVTIRVLKDLEVLRTRTSTTIVSAALITDVSLLFALGVILGVGKGQATWDTIAILSISFASFFVIALLFGKFVVPYIYRLLKWMRTGEAAFAVAIGLAIAFAVLAERVGLPGVIGAFIAGLFLRETGKGLRVWTHVQDILAGVTLGFLAPVFFVRIGFSLDFDFVLDYLPLFFAITLVAVLGKLAGSYAPARWAGLGHNESMAIGSMMMGKGAMELVFAQLALEENIIEPYLFSILVLMAFVSTILAPVMFRHFYNKAVNAREIDTPSDGVESGNGGEYF